MAASREPLAITGYHQKPRHKATISFLYQERSSLLDFATTHEPPPTNDACEAKMAPTSLTAAPGRDPLGRAPGLRPGSQRGWLWDPQKGRFLHRSDNKLRLSQNPAPCFRCSEPQHQLNVGAGANRFQLIQVQRHGDDLLIRKQTL